jgi:hypothetical protein
MLLVFHKVQQRSHEHVFLLCQPRPVGSRRRTERWISGFGRRPAQGVVEAAEGFSLGVSGQQAFEVVAAAFGVEMGLVTAIRWMAQFNCRFPDRDMRIRPAVLPDQTGIGANAGMAAVAGLTPEPVDAGGLATVWLR